jgi:hypothetical protein
LNEVIDKTYTQGYLGAFVDPDATANFTYRVEEMRFWKNP